MNDKIKKYRAYKMYGSFFEDNSPMIIYLLHKLKGRIVLWMSGSMVDYVRMLSFLVFLEKHKLYIPDIISDKRKKLLDGIETIPYQEKFKGDILIVLENYNFRLAEEQIRNIKQIKRTLNLEELSISRCNEIEELIDYI